MAHSGNNIDSLFTHQEKLYLLVKLWNAVGIIAKVLEKYGKVCYNLV